MSIHYLPPSKLDYSEPSVNILKKRPHSKLDHTVRTEIRPKLMQNYTTIRIPCVPKGSTSSTLYEPPPHLCQNKANQYVQPYFQKIKSVEDTSKEQKDKKEEKKSDTILSKEIYAHLIKCGYNLLAETLNKNKGAPWADIIKADSSLLMEQLTYIYQGVSAHSKDASSIKKMMSFCLAIIKNMPKKQGINFFNNNSVEATNVFLGKLLFLADRSLDHTLQLINNNQIEASMALINVSFSEKIETITFQLADYEKQHRKCNLQDSTRAFATRLSIELGRILITEKGNLNTGILSVLNKKFLTESNMEIAYGKHIAYVLKQLEDSPKLRELINSIQKPSSIHTPSNHLIRIILGLPDNAQVTDMDTKIVALAALFSHLRQGQVGSCFATNAAIQMLTSHIDKCLTDFSELLQKSCLTRIINKRPMEFPFLMRMSDESLDKKIKINIEGKVTNNKTSFQIWEAPGVQAACRAVGIHDLQKAVVGALSNLFMKQNIKLPINISIKTLLEQMIINIPSKPSDNINKISSLIERAYIAFESETHNPLLRMWENSIAGMAEARESGFLKQAIIQSIIEPIKEKLPTASLQGHRVSWDNFLSQITQALVQRIQLQFNPNIGLQGLGADGHSTGGAFELYDRKNSLLPCDWKLVDRATSFQNFISSIVTKVQENLKERSQKNCEIFVVETMKKISNFIVSSQFFKEVVPRYSEANKKYPDILKILDSLSHTPWRDKTGNDSSIVLSTYLERPIIDSQRKLFSPLKGKDLIMGLIDLGKMAPDYIKKSIEKNPQKRFPLITNGLHSFSILLGHPTFTQAWKSNSSTEKWVQDHIIAPGEAIAKSIATKETKENVITYINQTYIPKKDQVKFTTNANLLGKSLTVQQFRNALIELIRSMATKAYTKIDSIILDLDAQLCIVALPNNDAKTLRNNIIHFADTNWNDGIHDVHFCWIFNVGSGLIEMWKRNDNGGSISSLDQKDWIINKTWECILETEDLAET